jgi:elongation factor Ts
MAEITASMVKDLRESTGVGMMDCKTALVETNGDMEAAVDWLRKKGLAKAAKKSGRVTAEGLVGVAATDTTAAIVEINAETDFVARNEKFQEMVKEIAGIASKGDFTLDSLKSAAYPGESPTIEEEITRLIAVIGENMNLRRVAKLSVSAGVVGTYVHNTTAPSLGKIGVLVALESTGEKTKLAELGKNIAMHIAATNPIAMTRDLVDEKTIAREKDILREKAIAAGRPADIIEKSVEGGLRKFFEESVLMEQSYIRDDKMKISQVLEAASKDVGAPVALTGFIRYALGDGIEKEETDFAAEVQAQAGLTK